MEPIGNQFLKRALSADSSPQVRLSDVTAVWLTLTALALMAVVGLGEANAADQRYGSWLVTEATDDASVSVAGTFSQTGEILRITCRAPDRCIWMFTSKRRCQDNISVDALATSDNGTLYLELACGGAHGNDGYYDLVFKEFGRIDGLVRQGGRVGFAMALKGGEFQVTRFNTDGAAQATAEAARRAGKGPVPTRGLKDERQ